MKDSKYYKKKILKEKNNNYSWLTRLLLSIILILGSLIATNLSMKVKNYYIGDILNKNINFNSINKLYKKFISQSKEEEVVANVINDVNDYEKVNNSFKFKVGVEYPISLLRSGIIVYIGDKDDLGKTVIVQGNDGIDIWYSNIDVTEYSLYDYVKEGSILGVNKDDYYMITIMKDGKSLEYSEYMA